MAEQHTIKIALSWRDFRDIRRIRNECREFMTHDQSEISLWKQFGFWLYHQQMGFRIAYLLKRDDTAVAYGLIRADKHNQEWISGGVAAQERGKGYGKIIFSLLTQQVKKPGMLDVFADNMPARNLYRKLEWLEFERVDTALGTIFVMAHD